MAFPDLGVVEGWHVDCVFAAFASGGDHDGAEMRVGFDPAGAVLQDG